MERARIFDAGGDELLGILHPGNPDSCRGVLIVVGGPQYRVGSHRQFLLLARHLAAAGVPAFRFDYRGMGDSGGAMRDFERVSEDIAAAIDAFQQGCPEVEEVVIWGLCDAASAALIYAWQDRRVSGLVLANPWVRTEEGLAKAYLKTYYRQRLFSRDLWASLLRGRINPVASARSLAAMLRRALRGRPGPTTSSRSLAALFRRAPGHTPQTLQNTRDNALPDGPLPERMAEGWKRYPGPILLILSGDDLTAAEFLDTAANNPAWRGLLDQPRVTRRDLPEANHTFSRREWRDQVAQWTLDWVLGYDDFSPGRPGRPGRSGRSGRVL